MPNYSSYPFSTVEDLSHFFLWPLLTNRQQYEVLEITNRPERHSYFADCLATNGYPLSAGERVEVPDLTASIAAYLSTLDDTDHLRDWGGLTSREAALSELFGFLRWACQQETRSTS